MKLMSSRLSVLERYRRRLSPAVVPLAVTGQHTLHYSPNRLASPLDQQMNVIGHQAVSIDEESSLLLLNCEK